MLSVAIVRIQCSLDGLVQVMMLPGYLDYVRQRRQDTSAVRQVLLLFVFVSTETNCLIPKESEWKWTARRLTRRLTVALMYKLSENIFTRY
jgi:hypothetical protein